MWTAIIDSENDDTDVETKTEKNGTENPAFENNESPTTELPKEISQEIEIVPSNQDIEKEKRQILKNIIAISVSFLFLFTSFQSMSALQSSINAEEGLGTYSLSVLYGSLVLSCCFAPSFLINRLTVKWTLVFSQLTYSFYIAAQFYPTFATLIPAAIILGIGAAPMWSSKCTYLTHVGHRYAYITDSTSDIVIVRFFGIFFFAFQSSMVWGNLISSSVLSSGSSNGTTNITESELSLCGIKFCPNAPAASNDNLEPPPKSKIYTLASIYLVCSLLASVVVAVVVDPLTRWGEKERSGQQGKTGIELLVASFRHMRNPYQQLILPLTFWSGIEQGFFLSEFTRAYVSCAYGTENIGYVLICYGVCDALFSGLIGPINRLIGRILVFTFGFLLNVSALVILFLWAPHPQDSLVFFLISGIWGVADAVWQTQINALYGILFPDNEEAAFSNYRLWESLGFILAYILNNMSCVRAHAWIVVAVMISGLAGYVTIEVLERMKPRVKPEDNTSPD